MLQEILQNIQRGIADSLQSQGVIKVTVDLERSAQPEFGDFSCNVAMRYAKELSKNPIDLADQLVVELEKKEIAGLDRIEVVKPGFLNFYLTDTAKTQHLSEIREVIGDFGNSELHKGEKWVVEHTSPNPNKAMHLGHLRNALVGNGIVNLLRASGAEVVADAVYNNRGIAIAKVMYGYLTHMRKEANAPVDTAYWYEHQDEWFTPEEKEMKPDVFVTQCYVLAEKDVSENEEIEQLVRQMVIDWEAGEENTWKLWGRVLGYAYSGINRTLDRIGSHWDKVWYEHEHYQEGKAYVEKGLADGVFQKLEDGAVLTNLENEYDLPDTVLLKRDGTSLYITQDVALTDQKKKTYEADKLVWVIGPEQSLAMKQLFAVCEQLGIGKVSDFTHVSYGYVGLKDESGAFKKMSSRAGTVVLIDDVIDTVKEVIKTHFQEEGRHNEKTQNELAEKLALAAVKFAFLKSDRNQGLTFDVEQSVDVQGDSGMYVMYTYVRTCSVIRKAEGADFSTFPAEIQLGQEADLVRLLLYFEDVVKKSVNELSVHHVAQYLLELCGEFNSWYAKETILDGSDRESYRLAVVEAVGITIHKGLSLLGIETVDEM